MGQSTRGIYPDSTNSTRRKVGLDDLHVHDLRHTVGMRLREAGVAEGTISEILWHAKKNVTQLYTMAQIVELHGALEKIKADNGQWNKSLQTLRLEQAAGAARSDVNPPEVPRQRKTA